MGFVRLFSQRLTGTGYVRLAAQCHRYYNLKVRKPANESLQPGEQPLPRWSARCIYEHFTDHMKEHTLSTKVLIEHVQRAAKHLEGYGLWVEGEMNGEIVKVPTEKGIAMLDKLVAMHHKLFNSKRAGSTMFSSSVYGDDGEAVAPIMGLSDRKVHTTNPDRFYGRSILSSISDAGRGATTSAAAKRDKGFVTTVRRK